MPPHPDYSKSFIYSLCSAVDDKIFIGCSCGETRTRLFQHKAEAQTKSFLHVYEHFLKIGIDNMKLIVLEKYPCKDILELTARKQYWINALKPELNKERPPANREERIAPQIRPFVPCLDEYYHCDCGSYITPKYKSAHFKTKKHLRFINQSTVQASHSLPAVEQAEEVEAA